jgi:hypothetical protein
MENLKIWQKYLLQKKKDALNKKALVYSEKTMTLKNIANVSKVLNKPNTRVFLARYVSQQEINLLTLNDF